MPTPGAVRVGVFVRQCLSEILEIIDQARLDMVQLHGEQSPVLAAEIGPERIIRVFWPEKAAVPGAESLDDLFNRWLHLAKWFLFDAGLAAGGHGRRLAVKFKCPKPYFLAGGLTGTDVVSGWPPADPNLVGFDLNSSLESSPGRKDPAAIRAMMASLGTIKTLPQSL
jgi:phosphoribosylanthranilate isomerase